jgi:spermidine/putrescine transport system substrate-binding protein
MKKSIAGILAAALCSTLVFTACSKNNGKVSYPKDESESDRTLYLFTWTYYTPDNVIKAFEDEFNCKVVVDTYDSNEVMYTKLKAGAAGYDITFPSQDYASIMIEENMLRPIDQAKFTNRKNINPAIFEKIPYDPDMKYAVPYYMGAAGIAVNKQLVKDYEKSWNIFAREDLKDHMSMMDDMREVLGDALAYQGKSVNAVDDESLAAAAKLVKEQWAPNLVKFDAEGFGKSFASGDFWVCQGYAEVIYAEVAENKQKDMIDFFIPPEGGPMYIDSMVILKDSKHYALANEFINFIHRPENYAQFLDFFRFPSFVNPSAEAYMTKTPMYSADEMKNCELKLDLGEDLEKFNDVWQDIRFGVN